MNLNEFTSPLPKDWLEINAHIVNADIIKIGGSPLALPTAGNYNASITAGSNISAITGAQVTEYVKVGNIVQLNGSFTATVAASVNSVSFSLNTLAGTTTVLANYRNCIATGHSATASFASLISRDLANTSPSVLVVTLNTCTNGNEPASATAGVVFNYSICYTAA